MAERGGFENKQTDNRRQLQTIADNDRPLEISTFFRENVVFPNSLQNSEKIAVCPHSAPQMCYNIHRHYCFLFINFIGAFAHSTLFLESLLLLRKREG